MAEYIELSQATTLFGDVDARFDTVEGKIPSNASSGNKMVTASDIATKADLVDGKVPAAQLPSFVDDVLEYASTSAFPATGESGKIYVALDTNKTYRWGGSDYVEISESLALGETSSTAYAGDKGKANADAISDIQDLIPSTATSSNKFATASDIPTVPTALADLTDDSTHRLVTDTEKTAWNGNTTDIATINGLIPSGASTSNKLATASDIPDTSGLQSKTLATTIGSYTTVEGALSGINDGKVDKETGKGLSTNDYDNTAKNTVDGIPLTIQQLQGSLLNKVDKVQGKGLSTNDFTDNDKTALQTTIPLEISQLQGSLLNKVDKVNGKGLSTNDYDDTAKGIVDSIPLTITQLQGSLLEKFPRSEQRVLGAMNIIPNKAVSKSQNNVTWVVNADKSITISSNNSSADTFIPISSKTQYLLPEGNYILSDKCGDSDVYTYIERRKGASGTANYVRTDNSAHSATFTVDYSEYDYYSIDIFVPSGMTFSNKEFKPMIIPADELDNTYIQPAMTNTGLTRTLEALATIQEGTVTSTFNIDATDKTVKKQRNIVIPCVNIANVTATAYETVVATIPEGFRPSKTTRILVIIAGTPRSAYVESNGNVKLQVGASSERVFISGTCWITS